LTGLAFQPVFNAAMTTQVVFRDALQALSRGVGDSSIIGSANWSLPTVLIPAHLLQAETLTALIEDFVTRDGTDNGDETPLETRVQRVRRALDKGEAVIVFDPDSQQCQLAMKRDVPKEWLEALQESLSD